MTLGARVQKSGLLCSPEEQNQTQDWEGKWVVAKLPNVLKSPAQISHGHDSRDKQE